MRFKTPLAPTGTQFEVPQSLAKSSLDGLSQSGADEKIMQEITKELSLSEGGLLVVGSTASGWVGEGMYIYKE